MASQHTLKIWRSVSVGVKVDNPYFPEAEDIGYTGDIRPSHAVIAAQDDRDDAGAGDLRNKGPYVGKGPCRVSPMIMLASP